MTYEMFAGNRHDVTTLQDIVLPVRTAQATSAAVRLRVVARLEPALAQLLARLGLEVPQQPKIVEQKGM